MYKRKSKANSSWLFKKFDKDGHPIPSCVACSGEEIKWSRDPATEEGVGLRHVAYVYIAGEQWEFGYHRSKSNEDIRLRSQWECLECGNTWEEMERINKCPGVDSARNADVNLGQETLAPR